MSEIEVVRVPDDMEETPFLSFYTQQGDLLIKNTDPGEDFGDDNIRGFVPADAKPALLTALLEQAGAVKVVAILNPASDKAAFIAGAVPPTFKGWCYVLPIPEEGVSCDKCGAEVYSMPTGEKIPRGPEGYVCGDCSREEGGERKKLLGEGQ